jgi:hypothetical protein
MIPTFEQVVANDFGCQVADVTIIHFSCAAGSNKGDNFTCVVIAVDVKAKVSIRSFVKINFMILNFKIKLFFISCTACVVIVRNEVVDVNVDV